MDERNLMAETRYVPMNPVCAGRVSRAADSLWPSAGAYISGRDDGVAVLASRRSRTTGRPVGDIDWISALEAATKQVSAAARRGPKPKRLQLQIK